MGGICEQPLGAKCGLSLAAPTQVGSSVPDRKEVASVSLNEKEAFFGRASRSARLCDALGIAP